MRKPSRNHVSRVPETALRPFIGGPQSLAALCIRGGSLYWSDSSGYDKLVNELYNYVMKVYVVYGLTVFSSTGVFEFVKLIWSTASTVSVALRSYEGLFLPTGFCSLVVGFSSVVCALLFIATFVFFSFFIL